jgi:hypothetical protein
MSDERTIRSSLMLDRHVAREHQHLAVRAQRELLLQDQRAGLDGSRPEAAAHPAVLDGRGQVHAQGQDVGYRVHLAPGVLERLDRRPPRQRVAGRG